MKWIPIAIAITEPSASTHTHHTLLHTHTAHTHMQLHPHGEKRNTKTEPKNKVTLGRGQSDSTACFCLPSPTLPCSTLLPLFTTPPLAFVAILFLCFFGFQFRLLPFDFALVADCGSSISFLISSAVRDEQKLPETFYWVNCMCERQRGGREKGVRQVLLLVRITSCV